MPCGHEKFNQINDLVALFGVDLELKTPSK
jgi:hypothetical protein